MKSQGNKYIDVITQTGGIGKFLDSFNENEGKQINQIIDLSDDMDSFKTNLTKWSNYRHLKLKGVRIGSRGGHFKLAMLLKNFRKQFVKLYFDVMEEDDTETS